MYTIFLPFYIYYKLDDKYRERINKKRYEYMIKNKENYKNKVLKEIIKYIVNKDIPRTRPSKDGDIIYTIFLDKQNDDLNGDLHLKDFISYWSYGNKYNKKSRKYYRACSSLKQSIEYNWFLDQIEKYFKESDIKVIRDYWLNWGNKYEYIDLIIK
ncbi:hypothetical protein [Tissierella praeacuta]|uniref:hypothetical protein n=1 Tax=Tissierella praeacuta TaxID=43131 RepID=UPI003DA3BB24